MKALSKKGLTVTIEIPDTAKEPNVTTEPDHDRKLDRALDALAEEVESHGYTEFDFEFIAMPYATNRGKLHARGSFVGPTPFGQESRAPEDVSEFSFSVVEDEDVNAFVIDVKHESALVATFKIIDDGIELIDGDLPKV